MTCKLLIISLMILLIDGIRLGKCDLNESFSESNHLRIFKIPNTDQLLFRWSLSCTSNNKTQDCLQTLSCWNFNSDENSKNETIFTKDVSGESQLQISEKIFENKTSLCQIKTTWISSDIYNESNITKVDFPSMSTLPIIQIGSENGFYEIDLDLLEEYTYDIKDISLMDYNQQNRKTFLVQNKTKLVQMDSVTETFEILFETNSKILAIAFDWIRMILYWSQREHDGSSLFYLNLMNKEKNHQNSEKLLYVRRPITLLRIDPWQQILYGISMQSELNEPILCQLSVKSEETSTVTCLGMDQSINNESLSDFTISIFQLDLLITYHSDHIVAIDVNQRTYKKIQYPGIQSISRDRSYIYINDKYQGIIAINRNGNIWKTYHQPPNQSQLLAFYLQNLPNRNCLVLDNYELETKGKQIELVKRNHNTLVLSLPLYRNSNCSVEVPGIWYIVKYWNDFLEPRTIETLDRYIQITNLKAETKYSVQVNMTNYYGNQINLEAFVSPKEVFSTSANGILPIFWNFTAMAISSTEAIINWKLLANMHNEETRLELHWKRNESENSKQKMIIENMLNGSAIIKNLIPNSKYNFWVEAILPNKTFNSSKELEIKTHPHLGNFHLVNAGSDFLEISWSVPTTALRYILEYRKDNISNKTIVLDSAPGEFRYEIYKIKALQSNTTYHFSAQVFYMPNDASGYEWPGLNESFPFRTTGSLPLAPGRPTIVHLSSDTFNISWTASNTTDDHPILLYNLQGLQSKYGYRTKRSLLLQLPVAEEPKMTVNPMWSYQSFVNGNQTYHIVNHLHAINLSMFRVRAANVNGWGPFSSESNFISPPYISTDKRSLLIAAITFPLLVIGTFLLIVYSVQFLRNRNSIFNVPTMLQYKFMERRLPLAILSDTDVALLPKVDKADLTIFELLARGAYGDIYEGLFQLKDEKNIRVAIKTLRVGSDQHTKMQFLQQGVLMNSFSHKNILDVVGICLDVDFTTILMEFMSEGNLLCYLRKCRTPSNNGPIINTDDLISMCGDVASACRYLVEEANFILGNISCHNCLVSIDNKQRHVVKISDFGLIKNTRILKNENNKNKICPPIRWMPPESLRKGQFCTQSDVWSFGVLCWEIFTFGEQPYATKTNFEVMQFVKDGGTLNRPQAACNTLFNLMNQCWSFEPRDRPTFLEIDDFFKDFQSK